MQKLLAAAELNRYLAVDNAKLRCCDRLFSSDALLSVTDGTIAMLELIALRSTARVM